MLHYFAHSTYNHEIKPTQHCTCRTRVGFGGGVVAAGVVVSGHNVLHRLGARQQLHPSVHVAPVQAPAVGEVVEAPTRNRVGQGREKIMSAVVQKDRARVPPSRQERRGDNTETIPPSSFPWHNDVCLMYR